MAAIGKIREHSTLLLIVIGGAMVAFVLGDMFSNQGGAPEDQYVGEVFGEEINMKDYEMRVEAQKQSMASIGQPVSTSAEQQIRNQVWNDMVQERIMYTEMNKIGLRLGQDEFDDIRFGENVMDDFKQDQTFQDPETGQFDPKLVQNYFSIVKEQYPLFYNSQVNRVVNQRLYEKYNNLVKMGVYMNDVDAKDAYFRETQKVSFDYAVKAYTSVADSLVDVTDADLLAYYNENKESGDFDRDAFVKIQFVIFDVEPTLEDEQTILDELATYVPDFKNAKNDSLFVLKYSDSRNAMTQDLLTADSDELPILLETAVVGEVVGPYKSGTNFAIAKITEKGTEEQATVRHILLSNQTEPNMDVLQTRADSIVKAIKGGADFEVMVTEYSEDPGSVSKGGKYEWFNRKTMVEPFTDASFDEPINSLNIVETTYGIHIVEPLERRDTPTAKGLVVDARIEPSNETFNQVYDEANEFSIAAENVDGLVALAEERTYEVKEGRQMTVQSRNIPGVANSAEAVRWAHNKETKIGAVSEPFEFDRQIVVVGLENKTETGVAPLENVKEDIRPIVLQEKKAEMFIAEMNGKSIETLKSEGVEVKTAAGISEQRPNLPGGANEPYVVGYAFTMAPGAESSTLKGNVGVYVIKLNSKDDIELIEDYTTYRVDLVSKKQSALNTYNSGVYRALKDFASVKDERANAF